MRVVETVGLEGEWGEGNGERGGGGVRGKIGGEIRCGR